MAVLAYVLKNYFIRPAVRGRESQEQAAKRIDEIVEDSYFFLAPKISRPRDGGVVLVART